ncbi:MAG: phosphoribosylglycinamide formyltransferase [bacterium]|nr:phosphoribosylglycinamide formyltransferase [bacterium]
MEKKRIGVLISGRGSNMSSLIEACKSPEYPAEISVVISNRPKAAGLENAAREGIRALTINHRKYDNRTAFETDLHQALVDAQVELICNAGFLRLLTAEFVDKWHDRQLNIHPSLLPSFKGLHTHQRVLDAGVKVTGCTVHLVRTDMDAGPIIAQAAVAVEHDDDEQSLAARVLAAEHQLYPHALKMFAMGDAYVNNEKIEIHAKMDQASLSQQHAIFSPRLGKA